MQTWFCKCFDKNANSRSSCFSLSFPSYQC